MKNFWLRDPQNPIAALLRSVFFSIWNLKLPINDDQNLNVSSMLLEVNFIFCENETKYAGPNRSTLKWIRTQKTYTNDR